MKRLLSVFMALAILFTSAAAEFPITAVTAQAAATFTPRTSAPSTTDKHWIHMSAGGLNECILVSGNSVLPNCVGYAWGRAYEILGARPNLSKGDAGGWYQYNINNGYYSYGSTPKLGAIACWGNHVAVVEGINSNTSVMFSESNWGGERFRFFTTDPNTYSKWAGAFQGYIYIGEFGSDINYTNITPGSYYFLNKGTGLALNLDHNTDANLQNMHMYQYSPGYTTQQMVISLRSSSDKSYKIRPTISNRLIQTYGDYGVTTSGMNVNIYDDVNDNTQWWHFQAVSDGYVIRNAANTTCALTASNGNAIVSTYTGSANQIWTLQAVSSASTQKYTIAYNANGGSGTIANTEMTVGTAANLRANAFTRTGYTFLGWSTSASATTATYTDKQSVKDLAKSGTVTLYAVWQATGTANGVQSQIDKLKAVYPTGSYFSKDGKIDNGSNHTTVNGIICQNCYLPNIPARGGLPAGSAVGYTAEQCASFAYYAYYVIFGHNHGTKTTNTSTPVLGDMIHVENTSSGAQHWFIYLGEDSSNYYVYDANYGYTQQVNYNHALNKSGYNKRTIYHATDYSSVQPAAQKYTIAYNANGGSGTMANTEMTVGTAANLRANAFTRTGYTFLGWSASASTTTATYTDKQSVKDLAKSGTVTLYAVWKANNYTIAYNANGGSGTMANTEMTVGTAANLRANAFTRTGYTFLGWSTSASAATATYTDKQSVKDLANSGTVTLYAVWKANNYTIVYNANGGSGTMANTAMTYGTAANLRANVFTRTGYTFLGWSTSASAATATYHDMTYVNNLAAGGTVTLYAIWRKLVPINIYIPKPAGSNLPDTAYITSLFVVKDNKLLVNLFLPENAEIDISNYADGTYSFIFSPDLATNCVERTYSVTVSNGTLNLKNVELHLYGDVNGDGKINGTDVLKAKLHAKGSQKLSGYDLSVADVTKDGKINGTDVLKLKLHAKGSTKLW